MSEKKKKAANKAEEVRKAGEKPLAVRADGTVTAPGRRFLARAFDYVLYMELLSWAMALAGVNLQTAIASLVPLVLAAVIMFCLEPLMLWKLGTTPGKALLGLSVTGKNGKLTYPQGIARMDEMMSQGAGWLIPIWSQIKMCKSCRRGLDGKLQPWDKNAPVRQKGNFKKYAVVFAAACVLVSAADVVIMKYAELPGNRGDLTVEEFAENFTRQTSVWNVGFSQLLDENGQWKDWENSYVSSSAAAAWKDEIPFRYTVEDGRLTAVTITAQQEGREEPYLKLPHNQVIVAVSSFVWAQKDVPLWGEARMELLREIVRQGMNDYTLEQAGVTVSCRTETEGFRVVEGKLEPIEGAERYFASYTFTMELQD